MRILLVSQWYDPEPNFKATPLGVSLAARGHRVTALTAFPNYPYGRIYPGYRQRLWQAEEHDGVRVLRVPLYPDHSSSGLRRALHYLSFATTASLVGAALCGPADVAWVYPSAPHRGHPGVVDRLVAARPVHLRNPGHLAGDAGSDGNGLQ